MISGIESAKLKLRWASKNLDTIDDHIRAYAARDPYEIITKPDGKEYVHIKESPPPEISILAGETVYQIRSALDHLAFDLVKLNQSTLPQDWWKRCEFPLLIEVPTSGNPPVPYQLPAPYAAFKRFLPQISVQAFTFIESVQPYYRRDAGNKLRLLANLSNIDKHRHLNLTPARPLIIEHVHLSYGASVVSVKILKDGTKLETSLSPDDMANTVKVDRSFQTLVLFDESALGDAATLPICNILEACLNTAETLIVPAFEKFIQNL